MSSWVLAAWLMLGGSLVLLFIGMPVAASFVRFEDVWVPFLEPEAK